MSVEFIGHVDGSSYVPWFIQSDWEPPDTLLSALQEDTASRQITGSLELG